MRDQGSVCKLWCMVVLNAPLAFSLFRLLPSRGNCLSFLFINQKMKVNLAIFPSPFFSPPSFHARECVMNELCLCEVAEIHFVVSNMDFYTGRSLMSLHVFKILFVRAFMCVCSCLIMCVKVFSCLCVCVWVHLSVFLCVCVCVYVCFQVYGMCDKSVGLPVEYKRPHLQRHGQQHDWPQHHQAPWGQSSQGLTHHVISESTCLINGKSVAEVSKETSNHHMWRGAWVIQNFSPKLIKPQILVSAGTILRDKYCGISIYKSADVSEIHLSVARRWVCLLSGWHI